MLDLAMDILMLLDTTILARGLLMLSLRLILRLPFFMVPMDMADMAWVMLDMDMLELAMDIPMLLDTTTLARGLLMPSLRPRLMLILLFFMVPIMVVWVMPDMDMLDLAMGIPMLLDTTTLARGLLMPSPRLRLILLFFMVPIMAVWGMPDMDMQDLAMDTPMLLDITTLARGLLMPSPRPRRMLPFSMVPTDMVDMVWDMLDMLDMPLTLMAMLATLMPGENKLLTR